MRTFRAKTRHPSYLSDKTGFWLLIYAIESLGLTPEYQRLLLSEVYASDLLESGLGLIEVFGFDLLRRLAYADKIIDGTSDLMQAADSHPEILNGKEEIRKRLEQPAHALHRRREVMDLLERLAKVPGFKKIGLPRE